MKYRICGECRNSSDITWYESFLNFELVDVTASVLNCTVDYTDEFYNKLTSLMNFNDELLKLKGSCTLIWPKVITFVSCHNVSTSSHSSTIGNTTCGL